MAFGSKMDKPSSSQEGGVVGLNFHQSKEVLINDSNGSIYTVRVAASLEGPVLMYFLNSSVLA